MLRLVFALLLLAMPANAQTEPSLIGAWRLVSFLTADASGEFKPVWDEPAGMIVYTADGHMSAQLYDANRAKIGPQSYVSPLSKDQPSYHGLYTYFGAYTQDAANHTLMHNVEGAMAPDWIGLKMDRQYRFLSADRLELKAANDPTGKPAPGASLLVWERAK
jgi:hypothetical protein